MFGPQEKTTVPPGYKFKLLVRLAMTGPLVNDEVVADFFTQRNVDTLTRFDALDNIRVRFATNRVKTETLIGIVLAAGPLL